MVPEKGSQGNMDLSRVLALAVADTDVAGRGGPDVLPGSAGNGSWHSASAGPGRRRDKQGCSIAVRDHNADRSRTQSGIRHRSVDGEPLRHEPSYPSAGGLDNGNQIMTS